MYCKKCGKKIDNDSKFCKFCGQAQNEKQNLSIEGQSAASADNWEIDNIEKLKFPVYDYPKKLFDFQTNKEVEFVNYRQLETNIQKNLRSSELEKIKDGLSNVLFWGYYRTGYGVVRIDRFREKVTAQQLMAFHNLVVSNNFSPINIKKIGLPEFSGFSFVSKIIMFLNPQKYVILDKKIMQLRDNSNENNPLTNISYRENDSGIRINKNSQFYYYEWCKLCKKIAKEYLNSEYAVDAERGFFKLVEKNQLNYGKKIISKFPKITK
ncbi:zinc ribbon domain-containing protein [Anaerophaga thermohalophila]|jgi:RNA polymerase subunit RPABC4/transcription elongation factor Spt4|uniref:zinc ribbon domain-containing protein n=1 Tax=Anaerophaga thermohalophila TaxID=177400 RepID=UPI00031281C9|nr:zinc ribbon domain-containing protein [Anaerophaga thermohalophila]